MMLRGMIDQAAAKEASTTTSWFAGRPKDTVSSVAEELKRVEMLKDRIIREGINAQIARQPGSGNLWG